MFVDSDRRWLLTATDDQFVDRCTIYWQLMVWFCNDDSHCEIRGQRPVDICYYGVGGRIPSTRCLVPLAAFCCWTCFLDSESNRYLWQTVESICAFCLVHGQRMKLFETRIDAEPSYIRRIRNWIYDERLSRPPSAATVPVGCLHQGKQLIGEERAKNLICRGA